MQHAVPANAPALSKAYRDLEYEIGQCLWTARISRSLLEDHLGSIISLSGGSEAIDALSYASLEAERVARELKERFTAMLHAEPFMVRSTAA